MIFSLVRPPPRVPTPSQGDLIENSFQFLFLSFSNWNLDDKPTIRESSEAPVNRVTREVTPTIEGRVKSPTVTRLDASRLPPAIAAKMMSQELQKETNKRSSVEIPTGGLVALRREEAIAAASAGLAASNANSTAAALRRSFSEAILKVSFAGTKKRVTVDGNDTILEARKTISRDLKTKLEETHLYIAKNGIWLKDTRTVNSYEIGELVRLFLLLFHLSFIE